MEERGERGIGGGRQRTVLVLLQMVMVVGEYLVEMEDKEGVVCG